MPVSLLADYLKDNQVRYLTIYHSPAFTAQEIAEKTHISGKEFAKTVMVKVDGLLNMIVVPATKNVNLIEIKELTKGEKVELATEGDFARYFPDCEVGAMPPFGNLYGIPVYVSKDIAKDKEITFNAGTHSEVIRLSYNDFQKLVHPKVIS